MQSDSMYGICVRPALLLQLVKTRKGFPSFILLCIFYVGFRTRTHRDWIGSNRGQELLYYLFLLIQLAHLVLFEGLAGHIFTARLRGRDEIRNLSSTNGTSTLPNQFLPIMYVFTPHAFTSSTSTLATPKGFYMSYLQMGMIQWTPMATSPSNGTSWNGLAATLTRSVSRAFVHQNFIICNYIDFSLRLH